MTSDLDSKAPGPSERERTRRFTTQYFVAAAVFVAIQSFANSVAFGFVKLDEPLPIIISFLPIVPATWLFGSVIRYVARSDEFEQLVAYRSAGVALIAVFFAALIFGGLANAGVALPGSHFMVMTVGLFVWAISDLYWFRR